MRDAAPWDLAVLEDSSFRITGCPHNGERGFGLCTGCEGTGADAIEAARLLDPSAYRAGDTLRAFPVRQRSCLNHEAIGNDLL